VAPVMQGNSLRTGRLRLRSVRLVRGDELLQESVLGVQVRLDLDGFVQHGLGVLVGALSARLSEAAACTFCPTMMMGSRTSCRRVWAIHCTIPNVP